jgi:hypothetical protein
LADNFAAAFDSIRATVENARLGHAYLIVGAPRGEGKAFAEALLSLLFCEAQQKPCGNCSGCRRVAEHEHPDVAWLEPESKGRMIKVDEQIRPLIQQLSQTSFSGGWKAGVILHADRMSDGAANAFLKTLEEPAPRSLLLLLTDVPQAILPTILSRCQRVLLSLDHALPQGEWMGPMLDILREPMSPTPIGRLSYAARLLNILDEEKAKLTAREDALAEEGEGEMEDVVEDEDDPYGNDEEALNRQTREARVQAQYLALRSDFLKVLLLWHRDVLLYVLQGADAPLHFPAEAKAIERQAGSLTYAKALQNVRIIEVMIRQIERNVKDSAVFEAGVMATSGG